MNNQFKLMSYNLTMKKNLNLKSMLLSKVSKEDDKNRELQRMPKKVMLKIT